MSTRLDRAAVERGIREMWDALLSCTQGEGYQQAIEEARICEARLRARLDAQDRLDQAAPEVLEACKSLEKAATQFLAGHFNGRLAEGHKTLGEAAQAARLAISKAK